MDTRKEQILAKIIEEYVQTAEPVSSRKLAHFFNLSPATLRNEMAILSREGYISQPHISSGRIPTELAYKFYVRNSLNKINKNELDQKNQNELDKIIKNSKKQDTHLLLKEIAKTLAQLSSQTIIVAFGDSEIFYTGVSNLFSQPEFADINCIVNLSIVLDNMDSSIMDIFDYIDFDINVHIGEENPFGNQCSSLLTKYDLKNGQNEMGMIGILGPIRMSYEFNRSLLLYAQKLINNIYKDV